MASASAPPGREASPGASPAKAPSGAPRVLVIGGGFCGLAAAWELGRLGLPATLLEQDEGLGGLAGSFMAGGERLEKFYHHWFDSDRDALQLIEQLGLSERVLLRPTRTGMYWAHRSFRLSTPLDLLRFSPLPLAGRIRLGLLSLRARRLKDWQPLEERSAADWLRALGGERVYQVVWEPLLRGKFGELAEEVAAVWIWNKLKLRGGSRGRGGEERLAYFQGGFAALADALADAIRAQGGQILAGAPATGLRVEQGRVTGVETPDGTLAADAVIATAALPEIAELVQPHAPKQYVQGLRRIRYLANICIVLELDRSLSDIYWLNVNDPSFPFVGVIEHTNFEPASSYAGRHIVYLSRYAPESDALYQMTDAAAAQLSIDHLRRMFPDLPQKAVLAAHVWRAPYAQPVVVRGYRQLIPDLQTPIGNLLLATMAQIYPEDRGTNYAIRQGREAARSLAATLGESSPA